VSSAFIVISLVARQKIAEMAFAKDDNMVEALTPDRTDEPFCIGILPGRTCRDRTVPNAHGTNGLNEPGTIKTIPIADHIMRHISPGKGFGCCNARSTSGVGPKRTFRIAGAMSGSPPKAEIALYVYE